uniref:ORF1 n=1 Tax=Chaq virus-like 2 TaxID=1903533 RepID=A0A1C9U5E1_9VIRU|nr:ORF1 [Chaq virus-like 2]
MSSKSQKKVVQQKRNKRSKANYTPSERANDYGRKYSPGPNPPDVTAQPWWPVTISAIRKPGDYTFNNLIADFLAQVGKGNTFNSADWNSDKGSPFRLQVRFQKVAVWNLTGRLVSLVVWDIEEINYVSNSDHTEKDTLGSWIDCGGSSTFPAIGYNYPASHHRRVFRPDPRYDGYKILTTSSSSTDSILYHIKIEWRTDGLPAPTPNVSYPQSERLIRNLGPRIDKVAAAVEKAEKDREESNSVIKTVIDGVGYAANVVYPVARHSLVGDATTIASLCSGSLSSFADLTVECREGNED